MQNEVDSMFSLDLLFDFYGQLLTDHQRCIFEAVMFDDRSVSEVAREEGISRQSVSDLLKRVREQLDGYESRLGLVGRFRDERKALGEIRTLAEAALRTGDMEPVAEILGIVKRLEQME